MTRRSILYSKAIFRFILFLGYQEVKNVLHGNFKIASHLIYVHTVVVLQFSILRSLWVIRGHQEDKNVFHINF